jgi:hypothetical protein
MKPNPLYNPIWLALYTVLMVCVIIWALILSRPRPVKPKLRQVNPALFAKSEWAYTFRREWRGEQE